MIINMTPHNLTIVDAEGNSVEFEKPSPETEIPRLVPWRRLLCELNGIRLYQTELGKVEGLPPRDRNKILIVSALVAEHPSLDERPDLVYPGEAIRDEEGRIVGANGLCAGKGMVEAFKD